jgi:hypothetical protein
LRYCSWEPFLQSFAAIVVLVVALSIQLYVQPFELIALNLLEVASLACLLSTQLSGVLMWYKELPGKNDNAAMYRSATTLVLFASNAFVIASFVLVTVWYYLKQKSKLIVQWLPFTLTFFNALVRAEETLRWPNGNSLLASELADIREDWSFFAALREGTLYGRGAGHAARKRMAKVTAKLSRAVNSTLRVGVDGSDGRGALRSGAARPAEGERGAHVAAAAEPTATARPPLALLAPLALDMASSALSSSSAAGAPSSIAIPAGAASMASHSHMNPAWSYADDGSAAGGGGGGGGENTL